MYNLVLAPCTDTVSLKVETPTTSRVFVLTSVVSAVPAFTVIVLVEPVPEATTPVPTKLSIHAEVDKDEPSS